jgi:adenylylsulfate kinase
MFIAPERQDVRVTADGSPEYWAEKVLALLRPSFDPQKATACSSDDISLSILAING